MKKCLGISFYAVYCENKLVCLGKLSEIFELISIFVAHREHESGQDNCGVLYYLNCSICGQFKLLRKKSKICY